MTEKQEVRDRRPPQRTTVLMLKHFSLAEPSSAHSHLLLLQGFIQSLANEKGVDVDTASLNKADAVGIG